MKKILFSFVAILIAVYLGSLFIYPHHPETIIDLLKKKKNLAGFHFENSFQSEFLIINYWASWCPPCIAETPSLIKFTQTHARQFKLLAISQDSSLKEIEDFIKTFPSFRNTDTEIIWDDNKELARKMQVVQLPETFIYEMKTNKVLKISGSTNWEDPDLLAYIQKYFLSPTSTKDRQ